MTKTRQTYVRGYEVSGVSPLPHYFEEVYAHSGALQSTVGVRGDDYYFWYSKDGHGAAYYEVSEQAKSAADTYRLFSKKSKVRKYFKDVNKVVQDVKGWVELVAELDVTSISTKKLLRYLKRSWELDAKVFTYYLVSQPYRLQAFEDQVRGELKKRVAASRVDYYLAKLIVSDELTMTAIEEREWCELLIEYKKKLKSVTLQSIENRVPDLRKRILTHYDRYKTLTLGDGQWELDPQSEIKRFVKDLKRSSGSLEKRVAEIDSFSHNVRSERQRLEKELYLDKQTLEVISFLAHMGHVRYAMRVEGFIPLIFANIKITDEASIRLGFKHEQDLLFQSPDEFEAMVKKGRKLIPDEVVAERRGDHDEFMLQYTNGKVVYRYNQEAAKEFAKLVPPVDHTTTKEVSGVSAKRGVISGGVTVYQWGDDLQATLKSIKKYPILVAGQTRPAMMPIIRLAKGIITDEGGVTSHAAIVARELGIPTIINTHNATKVFKTGERATLDADEGIARKVK